MLPSPQEGLLENDVSVVGQGGLDGLAEDVCQHHEVIEAVGRQRSRVGTEGALGKVLAEHARSDLKMKNEG